MIHSSVVKNDVPEISQTPQLPLLPLRPHTHSEHDTAAFRELMNRETKGTESVAAEENEWKSEPTNGARGLNRIGESIRKEAQLLPLPPLCTGVMLI